MRRLLVTLDRLVEEPYASVICYPKPTRTELKMRVRELQRLGIAALVFTGKKQAFNVPVLGKGCVGIVTLACRNKNKVALKIRRTDADRVSMHQEAEKLKAANSVGVGPKFLGVSRDFLMMRFTKGNLLPAWLEMSKGKKQVKRVLRSALEQCWRLDCIGLDHGELSHAPKHLMITSNSKPVVLDFETSSFNRRPSNVTSICQFFFISGAVADGIARRLDVVNKETLVEALKRYKGKRTRRNFEELLKVCRL